MKKSLLNLLIEGCFILLVGCGVASAIRGHPAPSPNATLRPLELRNLLVTASIFPQGWAILAGPEVISPRDLNYGSHENLELYFEQTPYNEVAIQTILRFASEAKAVEQLPSVEGVEFSDPFGLAGWVHPASWSYLSPIADHFEFLCKKDWEITPSPRPVELQRCTAVARYHEFISIFTTPVSPNRMMLDDVERILRDIDARMAMYLK